MKLKTLLIQLVVLTGILSLVLSPAANAQEANISAATLKSSGNELLRSGQIHSAINTYKDALSLDPSFKEVYFNLAVAYFKDQNYHEAMACLEKLLALNPNDSEAAYNLACLYLYEKNIPKARFLLEKASSHCQEEADYKPLIQNTLGLLDQLQTLDPQVQDFVLARIISNALYPAW